MGNVANYGSNAGVEAMESVFKGMKSPSCEDSHRASMTLEFPKSPDQVEKEEAKIPMTPSSSVHANNDSIFDVPALSPLQSMETDNTPNNPNKVYDKPKDYDESIYSNYVKYCFINNTDRKDLKSDEYEFILPERYVPKSLLGEGGYGFVLRAHDQELKVDVAIKKRILRELMIMKHFLGHENILQLLDVYLMNEDGKLTARKRKSEKYPEYNYETLYLVCELMDSDLYGKIQKDAPMSEGEVRSIMFKILKGMYFMNSASVVHRDIKPRNILVRGTDEVKICDFGLSRGIDTNVQMTLAVVTLWYRAPELLMLYENSNHRVDVWALGCLFAELLSGKKKAKDRVLFRGTPGNPIEATRSQLERILDIRGRPSEDATFGHPQIRRFVLDYDEADEVDLKSKYGNVSAEAIDLLEKMLDYHPDKRITSEDALKHKYFEELLKADEHALAKCKKFEMRISEEDETEKLRYKIWKFAMDWELNKAGYEMNEMDEQQKMEAKKKRKKIFISAMKIVNLED